MQRIKTMVRSRSGSLGDSDKGKGEMYDQLEEWEAHEAGEVSGLGGFTVRHGYRDGGAGGLPGSAGATQSIDMLPGARHGH